MGSVVPLIAVWEELLRQGYSPERFVWVGTVNGPEKKFIKNIKIKYRPINAGKIRRYFSWQNFLDIIKTLVGLFESLVLIGREQPQIVISAGGYVSVPVVWAARFFGKKIIVHQQDLRPGLANKIMAPAADIITVAFEKSVKDFRGHKTRWLGNPVRQELSKVYSLKDQAYKFFNFKEDKPTILVLGGGTGATFLNDLIKESLSRLESKIQIIHLTGSGKSKQLPADNQVYKKFEFLDQEIFFAYAIADIVISRAGLSTLTELSFLGKPTIVVPIPESHQEDNAQHFASQDEIIYLKQKELSAEKLTKIIFDLLSDKKKLQDLSANFKKAMPKEATSEFIEAVNSLFK